MFATRSSKELRQGSERSHYAVSTIPIVQHLQLVQCGKLGHRIN